MKPLIHHYRPILVFFCISILFCACVRKTEHPYRPTITSYSPASAGLGDTVTVYGSHLPTDTANMRLTINNKVVPIILATSDSIKFYISQTLGSGQVVLSYAGLVFYGPVFEYDYEAVVTTVAGTGAVGRADGPGGQASFYNPWGIVADLNGDLYIAENYNRLIRKISAADGTVSSIPITPLNFYSPYNIALDTRTHNLYLTDFNQHVMKVHPDGTEYVINDQYTTSTGIGLGPDSYLYISDNIAGNISRIDTNGQNYSVVVPGINTPRNIIFDGSGNLYTPAYTSLSVIYKVTPAGTSSIVAQDKDFNGWEIARDTAGNFYDADHFSNTIRKIDRQGNVKTIAGSGLAADIDGIGLNASFNGPMGMTIDVNGNLFVTTFNFTDNSGNKVRKISFR